MNIKVDLKKLFAAAEQDGRADHQTDEQPLAGTFVFILGQGKCGLGDAHLGFARMR